MATSSQRRGKLKARQILALVESAKVRVLRPGVPGTVRVLLKDIRLGDAFCYEGDWFYMAEQGVVELGKAQGDQIVVRDRAPLH